MRVFTLGLIFIAAAAQGVDRDWTSQERVLKATRTLSQKLGLMRVTLKDANASVSLDRKWRTVKQQTEATEALVVTGAEFEEILIQFRRLEAALSEARRLMLVEGVCYYPKVTGPYQAVRLAFRRLDRNMSGIPTEP